MSLVSAARALRCPLELQESAPGSAVSSDAPAAGGDHGSGIRTREPGWGPKRDQNQGVGNGTREVELGPGSGIVDPEREWTVGRGDRDPPEAPPLTLATAQWQARMLPIFCVLPDPRALPGQGRARGSHFMAPGSTSFYPTALGISVWATGLRCLSEPAGPLVGGGWTTPQHRWVYVLFRYSGSNWWVLGGWVDSGAQSLLQGTACLQAFLGVWKGRVGNQNPRPGRASRFQARAVG